jgi:fused signal recognition particle receptor
MDTSPDILLALAAGLAAVVAGGMLLWRWRRLGDGTAPRPTPTALEDGLRAGLAATRRSLGQRVTDALEQSGGDPDAVFHGIEEALIAVDMGGPTATSVIDRLRSRVGAVRDREAVETGLRAELEATLDGEAPPEPTTRPWVILVVGVNGVGKTTSIGKLASRHRRAGRRVLLVAGDTYRAAAADQLERWAERVGAELVRQQTGGSPAAVVFDGLKAASARGVDVVIIDTAGRLHTRGNLMEELGKVRRVIEREVPGAPHETLLVIDATTGQNALAQARAFVDVVAVTGLIVTKLDGTARGGVVIAVRRELGIPVLYVGHGEGQDDLRPFDRREFVTALVWAERSDSPTVPP